MYNVQGTMSFNFCNTCEITGASEASANFPIFCRFSGIFFLFQNLVKVLAKKLSTTLKTLTLASLALLYC